MLTNNIQYGIETGIFYATFMAKTIKKKSLRVASPGFCFLDFGLVVTMNIIRVLNTDTPTANSRFVAGI